MDDPKPPTSPGRDAPGICAALSGALAVILGALGAHALEPRLESAGTTSAWSTAVLYHLVHAVAGIALGGRRNAALTGWLWLWGTLAFSGSLYLLALGGPRFLGPVTPLGGLLLIAGWLVWFLRQLRR
jgi:uncharacterized membrane protein YgdD (TMEM256/DUF423 family)